MSSEIEYVCPYCKARLESEDQSICPGCGRELRPLYVAPPRNEPKTPSRKKMSQPYPPVSCPFCGQPMTPANQGICPACGRPVNSSDYTAPPPVPNRRSSVPLAITIILFLLVGLPSCALGGCFLVMYGMVPTEASPDPTMPALGLTGIIIFIILLVLLIKFSKKP